MKTWKITAELYWCAEHMECVVVKANTKHKAKIYGELALRKKHPDVRDMLIIRSVERIDNNEIVAC